MNDQGAAPSGDPAAQGDAASVDVCVCTFHREAVVETLRSLVAQTVRPRRIIVVDNAEQPEALERVALASAELRFPIAYVHAPARNISVARNAALDAATAEWIAFIDDDEVASPGWLAALLATARNGDVDAVLGPVDAVYGPTAPAWLKALDIHSTRPVAVRGEIRKGYAGNVLLKQDTIRRLGLRFDLALGRSGGEDDRFFLQLTDRNGRIGFAPDAVVREPVPESRLRWRWLLQRHFRSGQSHGARMVERGARVPQLALALAKTTACAAGAVVSLPDPAQRASWLLRGAMHLGAAARLAGRREIELY